MEIILIILAGLAIVLLVIFNILSLKDKYIKVADTLIYVILGLGLVMCGGSYWLYYANYIG